MIKILTAYKNGLSAAWNEKKMLFWLYGFNLIFAYLITLPIAMMLTKALDQTTAADKLLQAFDFTIYTTIMDKFGTGVSLGRTITTIGLLYLVVNIFFAGGILKIFIEENKFKLKNFFDGCVEYFNRFLRLFLLSVLCIIFAILMYFLISKAFGLITTNSTTEHLPLIFFILKFLLLGFMLTIVNMLFDYAKIMTVVNDFNGMFKTVKQAMMFVMMSPRKTTVLYFSYLITVIFLMIIYLLVENFIPVTGWLTILIFFLWAQIFMISRIWIRMSFFAGQYSFYRFSNTAMPGMTKEMMDIAVETYEKRVDEQTKKSNKSPTTS
jgi:hypothetical protein